MGEVFSGILGVVSTLMGAMGGKEEPAPAPAPPPPAPEPEPVKAMPTPDDVAQRAAKRRSIAASKARRGRASTILTGVGGERESLGG